MKHGWRYLAWLLALPGHGPRTDYQALADYIEMLTVVPDRIAGLIGQGKSLKEVKAAGPTKEFDERHRDPAMLVDRAYASLSR